MDRSARAITWAVSVELLFELSGSVVVEDTEAVLSKCEPSAVSDFTVAWIRTTWVDPAAMVPRDRDPVQAGGEEGHPGARQDLALVTWAGMASGRGTAWASDGA